MPRPRRARRICVRWRRCGRCTSTRTAPNRARPGRCASAGSRSDRAATGCIPCAGIVLPEVAGQLQRAVRQRAEPEGRRGAGARRTGLRRPRERRDRSTRTTRMRRLLATADNRTRAQKQHDALATILNRGRRLRGAAAPSAVPPRPSWSRCEPKTSRPVAGSRTSAASDEPISLASARHVACSGAVQRVVFDDAGRIVSLGTLERIFTHHQRRAISLRDGGCIIPGCHVRAEWCEIHHVTSTPAAGRPTPTTASCCAGTTTALSTRSGWDDPDEPRRPRSARPLLVGRAPANGDPSPNRPVRLRERVVARRT